MPNSAGQRVLYFDLESGGLEFTAVTAGSDEVTVSSSETGDMVGRVGQRPNHSDLEVGFNTFDDEPRVVHTGRSLSSLLAGVRSGATRRNEPITQEERDSIDLNLETTTGHFSDQTVGESYRFENSANKCPLCNSELRYVDHTSNVRECTDEVCDFSISGISVMDTFTTNNGEVAIRDANGEIRVVLGRL